MNSEIKFLDKLKREVLPGINLFELVLFSVSTIVGTILFLITLFYLDDSNSSALTNLITLIDIPIGVIAATFLAKRSKLAPLLLSIDALLYGGANILAKQFALGLVNFILTPLLYMIAFIWIWPKQSNNDGSEVITRKFNLKTGILIIGGAILIAVSFGVVLTLINNSNNTTELPDWLFIYSTWFDSFAAAIMLMAVITSILRFRESWYLYFTSNVLKIFLFTALIINGDTSSICLLVLAVTYFINAIFGMMVWRESELFELKKDEQ